MFPLWTILIVVGVLAGALGSLTLTQRDTKTGADIIARVAATRTQIGILSGKTPDAAIADAISAAAGNYGITCPKGILGTNHISVTIDGGAIVATAGPVLCRDPWTMAFGNATGTVTVPLPTTGSPP